MSPSDPQSAEFKSQLTEAGNQFSRAGVAAIYCVHGTFVGNDILGLLTELSRFAPAVSRQLSRIGKGVTDLVTGEAGNYTRGFTTALEAGLSAGDSAPIPTKLFHWSSQNNHIARADGAIRLLDELANLAEQLDFSRTQRVQVWGHSHGGNVMAITSQLLGVDSNAREDFFAATKSFYLAWIRRSVDMPIWERVRQLLNDREHPLHKLELDMVTYGTPIRYGWNSAGYANLLHFIHHRPPLQRAEHNAPIPLKLLRACRALDGDYIQQIGISGTNFAPLPIAVRTLLADWRLDKMLEAGMTRENVISRLRRATRVPDEGTTLLVDYTDIDVWLHRHIAGHGLYTKRKWLPFHCGEIARQFYGSESAEAPE